MSSAVGLDHLEQLVDEAGLADSGNADQRDELRLAFGDDASERADEELAFALAADERCAALLRDVHAEPGAGGDRLPDRGPAAAFPFASTGSWSRYSMTRSVAR